MYIDGVDDVPFVSEYQNLHVRLLCLSQECGSEKQYRKAVRTDL